jgi:hypothetical protein
MSDFLDNRLTDGSDVFSLTLRPHFITRDFPDTLRAAKGTRQIQNSNNLIGS